MKLIVAIIQSTDAPALVSALNSAGHRSTVVSTTGGFLRAGNSTILIGVEDDQEDDILGLIGANCRARIQSGNPVPGILQPGELAIDPPVSVEVGGGVVFVLDVARYERL